MNKSKEVQKPGNIKNDHQDPKFCPSDLQPQPQRIFVQPPVNPMTKSNPSVSYASWPIQHFPNLMSLGPSPPPPTPMFHNGFLPELTQPQMYHPFYPNNSGSQMMIQSNGPYHLQSIVPNNNFISIGPPPEIFQSFPIEAPNQLVHSIYPVGSKMINQEKLFGTVMNNFQPSPDMQFIPVYIQNGVNQKGKGSKLQKLPQVKLKGPKKSGDRKRSKSHNNKRLSQKGKTTRSTKGANAPSVQLKNIANPNENEPQSTLTKDALEQQIQSSNNATGVQLDCNDNDNNMGILVQDYNNNYDPEAESRLALMKLEKEVEDLRKKVSQACEDLLTTRVKTQQFIEISTRISESNDFCKYDAWGQKILTDFEKIFGMLREAMILNEKSRGINNFTPQSVLDERERLFKNICEIGVKLKIQEDQYIKLNLQGWEGELEEFVTKFEELKNSREDKLKMLEILEQEKLKKNQNLIHMNQSIAKSIQQLKETNFVTINVLKGEAHDEAHRMAWNVYKQVKFN